MKACAGAIGLLWIGIGVAASHAQPAREAVAPAKLVGFSPRTAVRMATAQGKVAQQQWADAIAEYQSILDEAGDDWMPADPKDPDHCVALRQLVQMRLAALPAAGLRVYRARFDEPAQKWLDQAGREVPLLRRITDQAFCSRPAEAAIDLLGDLAFARGDFREAERWWAMLAVPASEAKAPRQGADAELRLRYPDPQTDPALIRAKLILSMLFRGNPQAAAEELKAFRAAHPKSEGLLAGQKGNYADTLQGLIAKPIHVTTPGEGWTTFAGDPFRNGASGQLPKLQWLTESWRVRVDGLAEQAKAPAAPPAKVRNPSEAAQALAFYPVIVGDRILVADCRYVTVFDLLTGKRLRRFDLLDQQAGLPALDMQVPVAHGQRYTLTVDGDHVYARLGTTAMALSADHRNGNNAADATADTFLVCLRLAADGRLTSQWIVPAVTNGEKVPAAFEGAPLAHQGRLYAARTAFTPAAAVAQIECYDAVTGNRLWRQDVAAGQETIDGDAPRHRQQLLTLAGNNVVYCTHAGAVVAVDAVTGRRVWAVRYPRRVYRRLDGLPLARDLAPAVYAAGRVYVAPADADRIFCLDANTGRTLWESKPIEAVHLLGVVQGRLIFTTGDRPRGIRGLDAGTGADSRQWMHPEGGHGELPSMGRGVFAGGRLLWPTSEGLRILKDDGQLADDDFVPLNGVPSGNLAVGNGAVIVATDRELIGYVSPARDLEPRKKAAAAEPKSAMALYRLALAEADARMFAEAEKNFWRAEAVAFLSKDASLAPLREDVWRKQAELAWEHAHIQRAGGDAGWRQTLIGIAGDITQPMEVRAWMLFARWAEEDGNTKDAVLAWSMLLHETRLRNSLFEDDEGRLRQVAAYAAQRLEAMRQKYGAGVLSFHADVCAAKLDLRKRDQPNVPEGTLLAELIEEYPHAATVRTGLARLAERSEAAKDHEAAAHANRLLARFSPERRERALALAGLARAYEGQGAWHAARLSWERLAQHHGEAILAAVDPERPVRQAVPRRLAGPDYQLPRRTLLDVQLPLTRAWEKVNAEGRMTAMPLVPQPDPDRGSPVLFGAGLTCLDAHSGNQRWAQSLRGSWTWSACRADTAVVADPRTVAHLRLRDGAILWGLRLWDPRTDGLRQFRLAAGKLFFLQGERRLCALDVETGDVQWERYAPAAQIRPAHPAGRFQPWYHAGPERVLIQSSLGIPLLLDSHTGKELPFALRPGVWLRPPVALNERQVCLVPDSRHVVMFDLLAGKEVWTHTIEGPASLTGEPPQLLAQGDTLLLGVARNYGHEVERLDAATGKRHWAAPVLFRREAVDLGHAAVDESAVYLVAGHVLVALALTDGTRLWDRPLTGADGGWRVIAAKNALLVHPLHAQAEMDVPALWRRWLALDVAGAMPTVAPCVVGKAAIGAALVVRQEQAASRFALLVCDPKDGQLIQRCNFAGRGTKADVMIGRRSLVVGVGGTLWGLQ
ncbi:hypothetical protein AYO44_11425 [Planctomycetaceae bacterium SCGC AG-212-F19]|nr:hypothetical protein AYO44_11425 [Planctomycetaceae bacterium SCGC AG-212-F19]